MSKRAERRHHQRRVEKNRLDFIRNVRYYVSLVDEEVAAKKECNNPCLCSGPCCGNPRRHFNEPTMQERKFNCE